MEPRQPDPSPGAAADVDAAPPSAGNTAELASALYAELVAIAHRLHRRERVGHTLDTSGIVHEAFLRLANQQATGWRSREYFLAAAATTMRRVLVDHARSRNATKRDGGEPTTLVSFIGGAEHDPDALDVLVVDDLLQQLAQLDERQARVVELRVFGGFEVEEVARILEVSPRTIKRDWRFAKAWLLSSLTTPP